MSYEYKDYYKILGVSRDAKEEEIKRAYRKLARKYHPDVSKEPNAETRFKELQEAYTVLKDKEKRKEYDNLGSNWQGGQPFRPPPGWQSQQSQNREGNRGGHFYEEADLGGFSDFFANIFGGKQSSGFNTSRQGRTSAYARAGEDQHAKITITLKEAYQGVRKTITLTVNGEMRTLKINIPAGVTNQQQLRLANQGGQGTPSGDLYLEINIAPDRLFTLQGRDVYLTLPIAPWEAALGAKVTVPTLGEPVEMKIPANTASNQSLRLKGKGLPHKTIPGDQYILLKVVTPPAKTKEQKAFYEQMAREMAFDPRKELF